MFANIKEVRDEGPESAPSVAEMRKSQADGAVGNGTQPVDYNESLCDFNQEACSSSTADDEPSSPSGDVEPRAWMP